MYTGRFSWPDHGPKDYAEACKVFSYEKIEDKRQLTAKERLAFEWILSLASTHGRHHNHTPWLYFSRGRLATYLRCCLRTVDRILRKLSLLRYIERVRRDPVAGKPQTALTRLGAKALSLLYRVTHPKVKQKRIATSLSHNELKKENRIPQTGRGGPISSIGNVIRGLVSGKTTLTGRPKPSPPDPVLGKEELAVTDFASLKAYLKKSHR